MKLPQPLPRPASTIERLTPLISQQTSRIPDLARHVLPVSRLHSLFFMPPNTLLMYVCIYLQPAVHTRATRLSHPPVLTRGTQKVTYGPGIPAPWNANAAPAAGIAATPTTTKEFNEGKGKDALVKPALQDARLYATWDYEPKSFKVPLVRSRGRMGSAQGQGLALGGGGGGGGSGVTISLGAALTGRQRMKSGSAR